MKKILAIMGIVLVFALAITACTMADYGETSGLEDMRKVTVMGQAEIDVVPDIGIAVLGVETRDEKADVAQTQNADKMDKVMDALLAAGIKKEDMKTQNYYLQRETKWDPETRESKFVGYVVRNSIRFETKDIENVGKYIDAAVKAGANNVDNVMFDLSKEAKEKVSTDLLTQAAATAKAKAQILAEALDARVGKVVLISENNWNVQPVYRAVPEIAMDSAGAKATSIVPGDITTNANIQVSFELI